MPVQRKRAAQHSSNTGSSKKSKRSNWKSLSKESGTGDDELMDSADEQSERDTDDEVVVEVGSDAETTDEEDLKSLKSKSKLHKVKE